MIDPETTAHAALFKLAGEPTRLKILQMLETGERFVGEMCEALGMGQTAVSHHLGILTHAGAIDGDRKARRSYYYLKDDGKKILAAEKAMGA